MERKISMQAIKNGIRAVVFLALVAWIGTYCYQILLYKPSGGRVAQRFYRERKNSVDVICFGSSHCNCTINNAILWNDFGIASYSMTAAGQQLYSTYYYIKESLKTQTPEVVLVELYYAGMEKAEYDLGSIYRNTLGIRWTPEFFEYVNRMSESAEIDDTLKKEVMLKFPVVHSRYRELTQSDFRDNMPYMRGYFGSEQTSAFDMPDACYRQDALELAPQNEKYMREIIRLCRETDTELIFFVAPYVLTDDAQMRYNRAKRIAEEENVLFVNFNEAKICEETGFDYATDMREYSHVNNSGAEKITRYMAEMIKDNVAIADRRGDQGYEYWDMHAKYLENKKITDKLACFEELNTYLNGLQEEDYLVVYSLEGNYRALGDFYQQSLERFDINMTEYEQGGVWVRKNGETLYRAIAGEESEKLIKLKNGELYLRRTRTDNGEDTVLYLNGEDKKLVENGINILLYDDSLGQIVDWAGCDVYLGTQMEHGEIKLTE